MTTPIRLALVGTVALVMAVIGYSLGNDPDEMAARRERIVNKTEAERDELRRRYETFQRLSEPERESIRQLHAAVEQDASLRRTLDAYGAFVSRLEPWDQQELRQLKDPKERLNRVVAIASRRSRPTEMLRPTWLSGRFTDGTVFPLPEFHRALSMLEESLPISPAEREQMDSLESHQRHLQVMRRIAERADKDARPRTWPDPDTTNEILGMLPEGRSKEWVFDDERSIEVRRGSLLAFLARSLLAEWQSVMQREIPPSAIRAALDKLPEKEQAEWARRDPGRLQRAIAGELEKQEGPVGEFAREFADVVRLSSRLDPFARMRFVRSPGGDGAESRRGRGDDSRRGPGPPRFPVPGRGDRSRD